MKATPQAKAANQRKAAEGRKRRDERRAHAQWTRQQAARDREVTRSRAAQGRSKRWAEIRHALALRTGALRRTPAALTRLLPGLLAAALLASLAANLLLFFRFSPARPLVTVGRRVVPRAEYQAALDQAAGPAVLRGIVYTELVRQAAAQAGETPAPADVEARLALMQRRNARALPALPPDALRAGVASEMALENLRVRDVPVTEAEVSAYYQAHRRELALPAQVLGTLVVSGARRDADAAEALLRDGAAPEVVAARPGLRVAGLNGFQVNLAAAPPAVRSKVGPAVLSLQAGQVVTVPAGGWFWTFRAASRRAAASPSLAESRAQVVRRVKLLKAPGEAAELAELYRAHPPAFDMERYAAYFPESGRPAPVLDAKTARLP